MASERKKKVSLFDMVSGDALVPMETQPNGLPVINPWNKRPYSQKYYEILEKRKTLPVWQEKQDFLDKLDKFQTMILVGETGSGKTTQVKP